MIVIIRDIEAATNNADSLMASGIDAIPLAVLSHMPIELEPNVLNVSYQAIIFTSKYGILNYDSLNLQTGIGSILCRFFFLISRYF